jgi:AcrR family transcriptional regulator
MPEQAPSTTLTRRQQRTREAILATAMSLYAHAGYGAVTVRAIAQELGYTAPFIYNYFLSKEEIFRALQARGVEMLADAVSTRLTDDPLADLRAIFVGYNQFTKQHRDYFTLMYVDPSTPSANLHENGAQKRMSMEVANRFQRCIEKGLFPQEDARTMGALLWSMVHGAAVLRQLQSAAPDFDFEPIAVTGIELTINAITHGLLPAALETAKKR